MSEKLYALLLRLFPARFRGEYGDEALRLFRDRLRDERGFLLRLRLWLDLLVDLGYSLPREYRRAPAALASDRVKPLAGLPSFSVLETEPLRPGMFLLGGVLALFTLAVFGFMLTHGGNSTLLSPDLRAGVSPGSGTEAGATPASGAFPASGSTSQAAGSVVVPPLREQRLDGAERRRVIDAVIADLEEHYADRDAAQRVAALLRTQERNGGYDAVTSGSAFAGLLTNQMQTTTQDMRLRVVYYVDQNPVQGLQRIDSHFAIYIPEARIIGHAQKPM